MKKIIAGSIIGTSLIAFVFYCALLFVNYEAIYQNFFTSIKVDFHPQNLGHLKVHKFPIPYLQVDNVEEKGEIELKGLQIRLSAWSLLKFKPVIGSLKVQSAKVHLKGNEINLINHEQLISDLIKEGGINVDINIDNLTLVDSANNSTINIKDFSLMQSGQDRVFNGQAVDIGDFSGSFKNETDGVNFQLTLSNTDYNMSVDEVYKDFTLRSGNATLQIHNIANFMSYNFPELRSIWNKINVSDATNIKFDIIPNDGALKLAGLAINSNWLAATGEISISKAASVPTNIAINFSKMDLNSLLAQQNTNLVSQHKAKGNLNFTNKQLLTNITIDQILLADNQKINNVKFTSNVEQGRFFIKDFSGTIESGGAFRLAGEVTQNAFRSVFDGSLALTHNNLNTLLAAFNFNGAATKTPIPFTLTSDLKCTLIDLYLSNVLLKTDTAQMTGTMAAKFIGSTPRLSALVNFSSIDLSKPDYPIISPVIDFATSLAANMKDKEYLNKFIPIRTLSYLGNFDLTFNDLIVGNNKLDKVNLLIGVKDDELTINNLYINNGTDYLTMSLHLQIKGIKPRLDIKIDDGSLPVSSLSPASLLNLRNTMLKDYSLDKLYLTWDCALSKLYEKDLVLKNIKFIGENDNILLLISALEADILSGNLKAQGSILLEPFTLNFVYALNSLDLTQLSSALPRGLLTTEGAASLNGMLTTNGDTLEKQLYNLYSRSSFVTKELRLNNFSIDDFIGTINATNYDLKNFPKDLKSALLTGKTDIKDLKGDFELTNGIMTLKNVNFQTKSAAGSATGTVNIYDFSTNLSSLFSFYIIEKIDGLRYENRNTAKMGIKVTGSIFQPQKVADTAELAKALENKNTKIGQPVR